MYDFLNLQDGQDELIDLLTLKPVNESDPKLLLNSNQVYHSSMIAKYLVAKATYLQKASAM